MIRCRVFLKFVLHPVIEQKYYLIAFLIKVIQYVFHWHSGVPVEAVFVTSEYHYLERVYRQSEFK